MRIVLICLITIVSTSLYGQFGFAANYNMSKSPDTDYSFNNVEVAANYWFRLKNKRVEFLPEVFYGLGSSYNADSLSSVDRSYFGLRFNSHFYLFDFVNDCDCPTFSKQGPTFTKGIYFNLSPGVMFSTLTEDLGTDTKIVPWIGAGMGYDIGINDLVTVSPFYLYSYSFKHAYDNTDIALQSHQFGVRLILRPDYMRKNYWN